MGKVNLNLLREIEEQENVMDGNRKGQKEAGNIVQDTSQISKALTGQPRTKKRKSTQKRAKVQSKENTKKNKQESTGH